MTLQVVGAGLGRTGTHSLKLALEQLLGGPCYHMLEVFDRPSDVAAWQGAFDGEPPDWAALFADYRAAVDWPTAGCWKELSGAFPDAVVLLSTRDADGWWTSASRTIFAAVDRADADEWRRMVETMLATFEPRWREEKPAKAAFERHNAEVRAAVPADRLVEWFPGDGWEPICAALDVAVPDAPFPHVNTSAEFRAMAGFDGEA